MNKRYENVPASRSCPDGAINSLGRWCLERQRNVEEDYRTLIGLGVISDNCAGVFEVAEADCERAIVALRNLDWL